MDRPIANSKNSAYFVWLCLLMIAFAHPLYASSSPRGSPFVVSFEMQNFDGAHMNTNVLQLPDGRLLVANQRGLFRFDGARWQLHLHPKALGGMEHLALGADARIYSSFDGDIGYFAPDSTGQLHWHSLLDRIPETLRGISEVIMVAYQSDTQTLWFATPGHLFRLKVDRQDQGMVETMAFPDTLHSACITEDGVLVQSGPNWLVHRIDSTAWKPTLVPYAEQLSDFKIASCLTDPEVGTLLVSYQGWIARDYQGVIDVHADLRKEFGAFNIRSAVSLHDGRLLLGKGDSSLVLTDRQGQVLARYGALDGIPGERRLNGVFQDRDGDVWLAQERSVSRIALTRAVTRFDATRGLPAAESILRWQGQLYVSNTTGLYRLGPQLDGSGIFDRVLDLPLRGMVKLNETTLIAHGSNFVSIALDAAKLPKATIITIDGAATVATALEASRYLPGRVWLGTQSGLYYAEHQGSATNAGLQITKVPGANQPVFKLAEFDANTVFFADRLEGVWRVWVDNAQPPKHYSEAQGLAKGQVRIYSGAYQPWFTTLTGLRVYDREQDRFVVPDGLPKELQQDRLFSVYEDHDHNLWVRGGEIENDLYWRDGNTWRPDHALFGVFEPFPTIFSFLREGDIVWAVRATGLLRFDVSKPQTLADVPLPLVVGALDTRAQARLPLSRLELGQQQRDLRMEFALPVLHRPEAIQYRSRLVGFDRDWTTWSKVDATQRIYTNLPDGQFELQVQARDSFRRLSELSHPLSIPAPWHRTLWARIAYVLLALLALWLAMRVGALRRQRAMQVRQHELEATVAERTHALSISNQQLAQQAQRLAEIDRLKTRFFINVGHEFRTPLSLVLGPLDDLLRDTRERFSERSKNHLQMAHRNAKRVLDLIVELLDVNRFEHGQLKLQCAPQDLVALLKRLSNEARALTERHGHELQLDLAGIDCAYADIDAAQIERALSNLISNAAKYMARGGVMRLQLKRSDNDWLISVADQGRGIAPAALAHVFDRFFQVEGSDHASGYGIGLSLVREIALAHRGDVTVQSEQGVGSVFTLRLAAVAQTSVDQALRAMSLRDSATPDCHFASEPVELSAEPSLPDPLSSARQRVLIADDHDDLRLMLRELLQHRFEVLEAADGNSAWQLARDELPDLIVSDVMMPGCDGVELTRRVRGHGETEAIGVLLLTAKVGSEHAVAGLKAGANDYLAKPFDASELLARCEAIVAHAKRLQHRLAPAALPAETPDELSTDARWRVRFDQHIAAHLHDPQFGIEALALLMHTDRSNVFRRCKEMLGLSPSDYLRDARLAQGHKLLAQNIGSVSEVAYACGYESLSSFTRAFKTRYGLPPSHIRLEAS